jgi:hypothetical protein
VLGCEKDAAEPNAFMRDDAEAPFLEAGEDAEPDGGVSAADAAGALDALVPTGDALSAACDLNGRWLVSQRTVATALGQNQASHNWFYLEIRHGGAAILVTRGLHCGFEVLPLTALAAAVDSSPSWPAFLEKNRSTGRGGTFVEEAGSCHLKLSREYTVLAYLDPSVPLPGAGQQASASAPGWEDWDGDGHPGISLKVTSTLASGTLYVAQRDWSEYEGTTALDATKFRVAVTYDVEQVHFGRSEDSSPAIDTSSSPSSDAAQHFAWFYKLEDGQATGSDEAVCAAVRSLKNELLPEANQ